MICVTVLLCLCLWRLNGVFGDEVKSVSVMEGQNVTLHTDDELQSHDDIEWMFGVQSPDEVIAEFFSKDKITFISERLKNHVEIDDQTGSLVITNITTQHTGRYQLDISRQTSVLIRRFNLTVYGGVHGCGFTEAVIRLVVSAVVGVATVAVLVNEVRS